MRYAIAPIVLFDGSGNPIDTTTEAGVNALEVRDERVREAVVGALVAAGLLRQDFSPQPVVLPTGPSPLASAISVGIAPDQVVPVSLPPGPIGVTAQVLSKPDAVDIAQGGLNDPMVLGDSPGSVSAKLRGLSYLMQQLQGEVRQSNALLFLILNAINTSNGFDGQPT